MKPVFWVHTSTAQRLSVLPQVCVLHTISHLHGLCGVVPLCTQLSIARDNKNSRHARRHSQGQGNLPLALVDQQQKWRYILITHIWVRLVVQRVQDDVTSSQLDRLYLVVRIRMVIRQYYTMIQFPSAADRRSGFSTETPVPTCSFGY